MAEDKLYTDEFEDWYNKDETKENLKKNIYKAWLVGYNTASKEFLQKMLKMKEQIELITELIDVKSKEGIK
jgi:flavodoxin